VLVCLLAAGAPVAAAAPEPEEGDLAVTDAVGAAPAPAAPEPQGGDPAVAGAEEPLLSADPAAPPDGGERWPRATLPPAAADPAHAPVLEGKDALPAKPPPVPAHERPEVVIRTILGLLALFGLAYLGAHPVVQRWERVLGISQVITAGFPFVVLGMLARRPGIEILSDEMLAELSPVLRIGLAWIGLVVGFRFDARLVGRLRPGMARVAALSAALPFAFVLAASGIILFLVSAPTLATSIDDPVFVRDALILGTAGAMAAMTQAQRFRTGAPATRVARVVQIEEVAGIVGLAIVAAYFRPQVGITWHLPGTAWLLVTIGLGGAVGLVTYALLQRAYRGPEFMLLTLGSVSFAAGLSGYLRLSPIVVAFIAGVLLANFPGAYKERLGATLQRLERPIYLLSLVAIGALWDVGDWRGWLLMPVFTAARLAGKWAGVNLAARSTEIALDPAERRALSVAPMGALAIAIVVNAQLLYPGGSISLIVSAVIGGAILTEAVVQLIGRVSPPREQPRVPAPEVPVHAPREVRR
jgi:Kef-type K+ transport system membrane component KefB